MEFQFFIFLAVLIILISPCGCYLTTNPQKKSSTSSYGKTQQIPKQNATPTGKPMTKTNAVRGGSTTTGKCQDWVDECEELGLEVPKPGHHCTTRHPCDVDECCKQPGRGRARHIGDKERRSSSFQEMESRDPVSPEWKDFVQNRHEKEPTCKGSQLLPECQASFTYKGQTYKHCITLDHPENLPWCYTKSKSKDDKVLEWGTCYCPHVGGTCKGTGKGAPCKPGKEGLCKMGSNNKRWCPVDTPLFGEEWGLCDCTCKEYCDEFNGLKARGKLGKKSCDEIEGGCTFENCCEIDVKAIRKAKNKAGNCKSFCREYPTFESKPGVRHKSCIDFKNGCTIDECCNNNFEEGACTMSELIELFQCPSMANMVGSAFYKADMDHNFMLGVDEIEQFIDELRAKCSDLQSLVALPGTESTNFSAFASPERIELARANSETANNNDVGVRDAGYVSPTDSTQSFSAFDNIQEPSTNVNSSPGTLIGRPRSNTVSGGSTNNSINTSSAPQASVRPRSNTVNYARRLLLLDSPTTIISPHIATGRRRLPFGCTSALQDRPPRCVKSYNRLVEERCRCGATNEICEPSRHYCYSGTVSTSCTTQPRIIEVYVKLKFPPDWAFQAADKVGNIVFRHAVNADGESAREELPKVVVAGQEKYTANVVHGHFFQWKYTGTLFNDFFECGFDPDTRLDWTEARTVNLKTKIRCEYKAVINQCTATDPACQQSLDFVMNNLCNHPKFAQFKFSCFLAWNVKHYFEPVNMKDIAEGFWKQFSGAQPLFWTGLALNFPYGAEDNGVTFNNGWTRIQSDVAAQILKPNFYVDFMHVLYHPDAFMAVEPVPQQRQIFFDNWSHSFSVAALKFMLQRGTGIDLYLNHLTREQADTFYKKIFYQTELTIIVEQCTVPSRRWSDPGGWKRECDSLKNIRIWCKEPFGRLYVDRINNGFTERFTKADGTVVEPFGGYPRLFNLDVRECPEGTCNTAAELMEYHFYNPEQQDQWPIDCPDYPKVNDHRHAKKMRKCQDCNWWVKRLICEYFQDEHTDLKCRDLFTEITEEKKRKAVAYYGAFERPPLFYYGLDDDDLTFATKYFTLYKTPYVHDEEQFENIGLYCGEQTKNLYLDNVKYLYYDVAMEALNNFPTGIDIVTPVVHENAVQQIQTSEVFQVVLPTLKKKCTNSVTGSWKSSACPLSLKTIRVWSLTIHEPSTGSAVATLIKNQFRNFDVIYYDTKKSPNRHDTEAQLQHLFEAPNCETFYDTVTPRTIKFSKKNTGSSQYAAIQTITEANKFYFAVPGTMYLTYNTPSIAVIDFSHCTRPEENELPHHDSWTQPVTTHIVHKCKYYVLGKEPSSRHNQYIYLQNEELTNCRRNMERDNSI